MTGDFSKKFPRAIWLFLAAATLLSNPVSARSQDAAGRPMALIPEGEFVMGSAEEERELGYRLDERLHNSFAARKRKWFEIEKRRRVHLEKYYMDIYPVTNGEYRVFVRATGRGAPFVDPKTWRSYRLAHPYETVRRFLWKDGEYPEGRGRHPVTLVDHSDAEAYCAWRGGGFGLPTEEEWEKAARGDDGRVFPWGNEFSPENLNSYDKGPFDTTPVGSYPGGRSPYGVHDMAGQVFEWTKTPMGGGGKFVVKGGSWDDFPGVTRPAARHGRPADLKHVLIGFRCVRRP